MRNDEQSKTIKGIILGVVIILMIYIIPHMGIGGNKVEKVRQKIEEILLEKYGEEFVVDRIGMRSAAGEKFYQARIYPKAIVGTDKEGDKYYYKRASVDIETFGGLKGVADTYGVVRMNNEAEEYLKEKAIELFGKRIRLKVDVDYERKSGVIFVTYYVSDFKKRLKEIREMPDKRRMKLNLYIYIFDKIDNDEEKEKRRREIFEYIGYLKKEGIFEYLEMGVIFIDERVLTPSYKKYEGEIFITKKKEVKVEGKTVYLPPMKLRKEMSKVLGEELKEMSEDERINNMENINKENLSYKGIRKYNSQYQTWIYSVEMLKANYNTNYEKYKKEEKLNHYNFNTLEEILLGKSFRYIYIDKNEKGDVINGK